MFDCGARRRSRRDQSRNNDACTPRQTPVVSLNYRFVVPPLPPPRAQQQRPETTVVCDHSRAMRPASLWPTDSALVSSARASIYVRTYVHVCVCVCVHISHIIIIIICVCLFFFFFFYSTYNTYT